MEAAYFGVKLWAKAVESAKSADPAAVRAALSDQSVVAPGGPVYIDADTQHTWKTVRIGRIRRDGQFDVVWSSKAPVRPVPFPVYRTREQWEAFVQGLYRGWGGNWANPGTGS
jgi:urea transport system substrate-binding protein